MESETFSSKTVAGLVAGDYRLAEIFKKYGIDFCCGGKKSIAKICLEKNINADELEKEVLALQNKPTNREQNFNEWTLTFLADYIVRIHHKYVSVNLGLIAEFSNKVALVHGKHDPETKEIEKIWKDMVTELAVHIQKEELVLFPYIKNIERYSKRELNVFPATHFVTVKNPVRMMEQEHDLVGHWMNEIQVLSKNFVPPEHACNTYKILYFKLQEFQNDLFQHIHLENNILFPKAIELEIKIR